VRKTTNTIDLTASDLSQFLSCRHRSSLELAVAHGRLPAPTWVDPALLILQERGLEHERSYVETLRAQDLSVTDLSSVSGEECVERTVEAMREGADVILQGALRDGRWFGRPDVLRRMESPSALGAWSYEVADTKLAKETSGGTILQLSLYSGLLEIGQAAVPEYFSVVTPSHVQVYRVADFAAYFRLVRKRLAEAADREPDTILVGSYPEPSEHCEACRWWNVCDKRRRADDHLSLVAGISRLQRRELQDVEVDTLAKLGGIPLPLPFKPKRGAIESYVRVREQARVQLTSRTENRLVHEVLPVSPEHGLTHLPEPSVGDVFLDFEGDPFAGAGGREYLFGFLVLGESGQTPYSLWAPTLADERRCFEGLVDVILASWEAHPGMHVYHYGVYEPGAMKRLMGRHATREDDVDRMLRAGLFVDLYAIVKHAIRAGVEHYSIKDLEPFYGFTRSAPLAEARAALRVAERAVELEAPDLLTEEVKATVASYNQDDCASAMGLRGWLESVRTEVETSGTPVPRPTAQDGAPSEALDEHAKQVQQMMAALTQNVPADPKDRSQEQQARWLLANLLDWHRREDKAPWWEFFRLCDLREEELLEERAAIAGLAYLSRVGGTARSPIDRYAYPQQETEIRPGDELRLTDGTSLGTVEDIDRVARSIDVKKRGAHAETHPTAAFAHTVVPSKVLADALLRFGQDVIDHGFAGATRFRSARELLLANPPRLSGGSFTQAPDERAVAFAVRIGPALQDTVLAIQGPPGTGKTYTGAEMICELAAKGLKVGITAVSHKVIRKLLEDAIKAARKKGQTLRCIQKVGQTSEEPTDIDETKDNARVLAALQSGTAQVGAGTAWLWARPEYEAAVDVLFVDEAGQLSLANALATSLAARSVVLLGDPLQLEQPQQGAHPEGADVSALEHVLHGHKTIPPDRGIFLPETWRLHPDICRFTSELFYEGRLHAREGLDRQVLAGTAPFEGAGLWVVPITHEGNQNSSPEEVDVVAGIVDTLLASGASWIDDKGESHAMTPADVLVVAPYNAQVGLLEERLSACGVRAGTVDRFQGQEAPVIIYSLTTSTSEDAPRGMEFLYSLNRLNVATSRARCACILVGSARLFEPECHSPKQMRLANALCRYAELARPLD
jgi:predicted RecB family nuclease